MVAVAKDVEVVVDQLVCEDHAVDHPVCFPASLLVTLSLNYLEIFLDTLKADPPSLDLNSGSLLKAVRSILRGRCPTIPRRPRVPGCPRVSFGQDSEGFCLEKRSTRCDLSKQKYREGSFCKRQ